MVLTHGSLFSGIGGFDLGFERVGIQTIWQVELDAYCQRVLAKHWPEVPRYGDIRTVHGVLSHPDARFCYESSAKISSGWDTSHGCNSCLETPTVITGGFPCQPFSIAGKRRGTADDRWLWPQMRRVIDEVRPRWIVAENVPGIIKLALDQVLSDLEALGYTVGAVTIPACAVDAPHRRERLWIVAFSNQPGSRSQSRNAIHQRWQACDDWGTRLSQATRRTHGVAIRNAQSASADVSNSSRLHVQGRIYRPRERQLRRSGWWTVEPDVGRVVDGLSTELDATRRRLGYAEMDDSQAIAAIDVFRGEVLRELWSAATAPTAPLRVEAGSHQDFMSTLSHCHAHEGRNLGAWIAKDEGLRRLWQAVCATPFDQTQDVQRALLIGIREKERQQKMGRKRVDRLRVLGNAVVPQIAEEIGWIIVGVEYNLRRAQEGT